jgi:hypothetical protein
MHAKYLLVSGPCNHKTFAAMGISTVRNVEWPGEGLGSG